MERRRTRGSEKCDVNHELSHLCDSATAAARMRSICHVQSTLGAHASPRCYLPAATASEEPSWARYALAHRTIPRFEALEDRRMLSGDGWLTSSVVDGLGGGR